MDTFDFNFISFHNNNNNNNNIIIVVFFIFTISLLLAQRKKFICLIWPAHKLERQQEFSKSLNSVTKSKNGSTALIWACSNGLNNVVLNLINKGGVDLDEKDHLGRTPLLYAIDHDLCEIALLLIRRGANVNLCGKHGASPLIRACARGGGRRVDGGGRQGPPPPPPRGTTAAAARHQRSGGRGGRAAGAALRQPGLGYLPCSLQSRRRAPSGLAA